MYFVPAEREKKMRCRAPFSTSHRATARPSPPRPPTSTYEAEGVSVSSAAVRITGRSAPAFGMVTTIFPRWVPLCIYRKLSSILPAGKTFIGVMGLMDPDSHISATRTRRLLYEYDN